MSQQDGCRVHILYLTSKNRDASETPYSLTFDIPHGTIYLDDAVKQNIKVSLISFSFNANWSEINSTNNTFQIVQGSTVTDIVITPGNYPFDLLAKAISKMQSVVTCKYDLPTNKLLFISNNGQPFTINLLNQSWMTLGFLPTDNGISGTAVISTQNLVPRQNKELYIRLNGATVGDGNQNYSNLNGRLLAPTTILSVIPVTAVPYQSQFSDYSVFGQATGMFVSNDILNGLSIEIVDADGHYASWISDWTATVRVQVVNVEEPALNDIKESLAKMEETLNKLLTLKVIGRPQNYVR
jgi:hypothetical protein